MAKFKDPWKKNGVGQKKKRRFQKILEREPWHNMKKDD